MDTSVAKLLALYPNFLQASLLMQAEITVTPDTSSLAATPPPILETVSAETTHNSLEYACSITYFYKNEYLEQYLEKRKKQAVGGRTSSGQ